MEPREESLIFRVSLAELILLEEMLDASEQVLMECLRAMQSGESTNKSRVDLLVRSCALQLQEAQDRYTRIHLDELIAAAVPKVASTEKGKTEMRAELRLGENAPFHPVGAPNAGSWVIFEDPDAKAGDRQGKHIWTEEEQATFREVLEEIRGYETELPTRKATVNALHKRLPHLGKRQVNSHLQWWDKKQEDSKKKKGKQVHLHHSDHE